MMILWGIGITLTRSAATTSCTLTTRPLSVLLLGAVYSIGPKGDAVVHAVHVPTSHQALPQVHAGASGRTSWILANAVHRLNPRVVGTGVVAAWEHVVASCRGLDGMSCVDRQGHCC